MKVCAICKQAKETISFNKHSKNKDGLQTVCRECNRARSRKYYSENKNKHLLVVREKKKALRSEQKKTLKEYKESIPCVDCKTFYPSYVMDFDHQRDKTVIVSAMIGNFSTRRIWEEIEKCELVCANCHRIRTHKNGSFV